MDGTQCAEASPCPCGEWVMCGVFGEFVERPDCEGCPYYREMEDEED